MRSAEGWETTSKPFRNVTRPGGMLSRRVSMRRVAPTRSDFASPGRGRFAGMLTRRESMPPGHVQPSWVQTQPTPYVDAGVERLE